MKTERLNLRLGGTTHWILQRLSAALLIPLALWLIISSSNYFYSEYEMALGWASDPIIAVLLELTLLIFLLHAYLGVAVIVEDYVKSAWQKFFLRLSASAFALTAIGTLTASIKLVASSA